MFVLQQQQNLGRILGISKMHLIQQWLRSKGVFLLLLLIVTPIVGLCYCSMFAVPSFVSIIALPS